MSGNKIKCPYVAGEVTSGCFKGQRSCAYNHLNLLPCDGRYIPIGNNGCGTCPVDDSTVVILDNSSLIPVERGNNLTKEEAWLAGNVPPWVDLNTVSSQTKSHLYQLDKIGHIKWFGWV